MICLIVMLNDSCLSLLSPLSGKRGCLAFLWYVACLLSVCLLVLLLGVTSGLCSVTVALPGYLIYYYLYYHHENIIYII